MEMGEHQNRSCVINRKIYNRFGASTLFRLFSIFFFSTKISSSGCTQIYFSNRRHFIPVYDYFFSNYAAGNLELLLETLSV